MDEIELIEELVSDFHVLNDDTERWEWFIDQKDNGIIKMCLFLDNDATTIEFPSSDNGHTLAFDEYIGNGEGVCNMLDAMAINYEVA